MKLIDKYIDAKQNLDMYKKLESELRIELLGELFQNNTVEGTEATEIDGYKVKGSFSLNFKLDGKALEEAFDDLSEVEQACISFKPSLNKSVYKSIEDSEREELDEYITVSSAMPTIKIERLEE